MAADWFRDELASQFASRNELSPDLISDQLEALVPRLPADIPSAEWPAWDFSIAAVLLEDGMLRLGVIGYFSAVLLSGYGVVTVVNLFTPRHHLSLPDGVDAQKAKPHDYRAIFHDQPFCPDYRSLMWLEPVPFGGQSRLLLGDVALPRLQETQPLIKYSDPATLRDDVARLGGYSCPTAIIDGKYWR